MHRMAAKSAAAAAASSPRWRPFAVALCFSGGRPALSHSFTLRGQSRFYSRQYKVSKGVSKAIRGQADKFICFKADKYTKIAAKASKKVKELKFLPDEVHHSHITWWKERMEMCRKPSTLQLIKRLVHSNLLGLDVNLKNGSLKEGNLNMELLLFKSKFPREVLLCRVGEFYEAVGFDACILVEHAGLNPFGGLRTDSIPRAGCPVVNLRQTLDDLTRASYSVCIVEEVQGPTQARSRKGRFISGHAHPGCPYLFGLAELAHDVEFPEPMPVVGISRSARGYCMVSILETMKTFSAENGLTEDALVMKLRTSHYHHLFLHASLRQNVSGTSRWGEFGEGGLLWAECHRRYFEWFDGDPTEELLSKVRELYGLDDEVSFRNVTIASDRRPRPLYLGTATQIGVIPTEGIPSLFRVILPSTCTGLPVMYLRDLILNPPLYSIAAKIQGACRLMSDVSCSIPDFTCISSAKLVKLLESKEANHIEFSRIKNAVEEILLMHNNLQLNGVLKMLLDPTWAATGLKIDYETLVYDCELVSQRIGEIIYLHDETSQSTTSSSLIPDEFFENMESSWKGRVKRVHVEDVFNEAEREAENLIKVVTEDFLPIITRIKAVMSPLGGPRGEVAYSREHDAVWFRGKRFTPSVWSGTPGEEQIKRLKPALDSRGRKVGEEWFTTERVENALNRYRDMCDKARAKVIMLLRDLSAELQGKVNLLVFTSMLLIISKALFCHVSEGRRRKWVIPTLVEFELENKLRSDATMMNLLGLSPYWFNEARGNAIKNSVEMNSLFLLTGPNGGGKSSLLRSICAAALLGMCGLMVPAESATIPHFDSVMLHVKSYDSPADGKSSFQIEMSEIRSIITEATSRSLILMDEMCRGTEMIKGTCIAGSIIENLDQTGCLGVVSTHLHDIFNLPLNVKNIVYKAMGTEIVDGQTKPTWRLIDGICRESLAFETAEKEGIPELIIRRAQQLYKIIPKEGIRAANNSEVLKFVQDSSAHYLDEKSNHASRRATVNPVCYMNDMKSMEILQSDVEVAVATICGKKLRELYKKKVISDCVEITCVRIGLREQPPPSAIGASCVYVIFRPDKKLYVGQTDDIIGRVQAHRSKDGIENLHFLYVLVPGKSLASELETLLINQLPARGFQLVNKADGNHRNFGTLNMHVENVKTTA